MSAPRLLGWQCDGCNLWLSALHYENNRYHPVRDGAPCALGRLINPCHGLMREVFENEDVPRNKPGNSFPKPEAF